MNQNPNLKEIAKFHNHQVQSSYILPWEPSASFPNTHQHQISPTKFHKRSTYFSNILSTSHSSDPTILSSSFSNY